MDDDIRRNTDGFLGYLRDVRNLSGNTVESYSCDLRHLADFLDRAGVSGLGGVDHRLLRAFLANQQARGYSRATVARRCACTRAFFNYLRDMQVLPTNPSSTLSFPVKEKGLPTFLTESEAARLADGSDGGDLPARDNAIIETLYATGMRVGELCPLKTGDLDLSTGAIRVMGKGSRERVVLAGEAATIETREAQRRRPVPGCERGADRSPPGKEDRRERVHQACWRGGHKPTLFATFFRDPPAFAGCRPAYSPGTAGSQEHRHDPDIHSSDREPYKGSVRQEPSPWIMPVYPTA